MPQSRDLHVVVAAVGIGLASVSGGGFEPGHRMALSLLLAGVAGWAVLRWRDGLHTEDYAFAALVGVGLVSAVLDPLDPLGAKEMLGGWSLAWLLFMTARRASSSARGVTLDVLAAAGVIIAAGIVIESAAAHDLRAGGGLLYNPNVALALVIPALAGVRKRWPWPVWTGCVTLGIVATVLTGSRAGALALVVVAASLMRSRRARLVVAAAGLVIAVILVGVRFAVSPDSLAWHRMEIWRALAGLVAEHPFFGVGPGALAEAAGQVRIAHPDRLAVYGRIIGSAESTVAGLVVRVGALGTAAALGAVLWTLRSSREGLRGHGSVPSTLLAVAALGLFHDMLGVDIVLWSWALLVGVSLPRPPVSTESVRHLACVRWAAAVTLAWIVLWTIAQPSLARLFWFGGPLSEPTARRAIRVEPWLPDPSRWQVIRLLALDRWDWRDAAAAAVAADREVRVHPGSATAWGRRAAVCQRTVTALMPSEDAVACVRTSVARALGLESLQPWPWMQLAQLERSLGRLDAARQAASRAVAVEPRFVGGWLLLARLELELGRVAEARASLDRAKEIVREWAPRARSDYERRLIEAPQWQIESLERTMGLRSRNT